MAPRGQKALVSGIATIEYTLTFVPRKRLAIEVHPDLTVIVRAPQHAKPETIENAVRRRSRWIYRQLQYFSSFLPRTPPRRFVSGESHLYLGRRYRLRVVRTRDEESVRFESGEIRISTGTPSSMEAKRELLQAWYRARARRYLNERFKECARHPAFRDARGAQLSIRKLTKRWGSCSSRGRITLNADLIRASRACIDYVITHELCHLIVPSHSPKFDRLLARVMPDWRERKNQLESRLS
ncbi:MAG: hypothetical protein QOC81_553 [Thermoanaerobaculia bacterium]|jgi:predicted metal-dependent hydrolase|nr:hypothetical protein [Thermoanaerobaculia bacterium]